MQNFPNTCILSSDSRDDSRDCKEVWVLWENCSAYHIIYYLSKQFPKEFLVLIICFKSALKQHNVHFVNYGSIQNKKEA